MDDKRPKRNSCWQRRTKLEKWLIVLTGFSSIIMLFMISDLLIEYPSFSAGKLNQDVCLSEKCIRSASSILQNIDKTVDPCDDFYKFTCGNFVKNTVIPGDKVQQSSFSSISDKVDLQLMKIYEEPIQESDPSYLRLVKAIYNSCMNTTQIEKESLSFVKKEFKDLGGWPVIEPYWNEKLFDWKNLLYRLRRMNWRRTYFFSMYIATDLKNSTKTIFTISQPCMPYERLKKGLNDTAVQASLDYMIQLAVLFGADKNTAASDMKDVIEFEISLAKMTVPYKELRNATLKYNPITIRQLQQNFSSIPWLKMINNYLSPAEMLNLDDVINVAVPKFFERFNSFLPKVKKRTLANYMFVNLVKNAVDYLPEEFQKTELNYVKIVYGKNELTPRWKHCTWEAERLNVAVSSIYVQKFFDKSIKNKVTELTQDIKFSFLETLKKIGWMDRKTKKHALHKAEKMKSFIAYPDEILDDDLVEEYHEGLELDPSEYYLKLTFNMSSFWHNGYVKSLREPVLKPDWRDQAYTYYVNAFYVQSENSIQLPAAILQDHFFDPERPQYMNYGGIGEVIGHEITHGFDDGGRQYDKDGNLIDWWEPETNRTFARKSQCLVEQYGNYTVPEIEMSLNGVKNLGENIADNGGIKIAYRGYLRWLDRNKVEKALPGLPYTPRQMFWISAATNGCTKYKKEYLKQMVMSGLHSPYYFRILVPFMNSDYFARDFNCPLGSPMNPKYKCRVW